MATKFKHFPNQPANQAALKGYYILINAHDASSSFLDLFTNIRATRRARGAPTDEEQDLLRAMLVFASSGLDSMVKQLVLDALPIVVGKSDGAKEMFRAHVERRIKRGSEFDHKFLAAALAENNLQVFLMDDLVSNIRENSIQSKDQLLKVVSHFDIPSNLLSKNLPLLHTIFSTRNEIIHEMDIDFTQPNRSRRPRPFQIMVDYANELFSVANAFLAEVDKKL
ncbi:MAG: hypothetical protein PHX83_02130 [Acidobacteriia bacterium]|nr:hypothetical protein [Terriglobia bacterium]